MTASRANLCDKARSILVVVDVQTRLMAAMQAEQREAVIAGASRLMRAAGLLDVPRIISEQYPRGLGSTEPRLLKHTPPVFERIEKTAFSVSGVKEFDELLAMSARQQVVLCGAEAHVCVAQSALQLLSKGVEVFVAADAVCSRDNGNRDNALARMRSAGVIVSNVESILFEWLGDAKNPAFRDVSSLIQ